MNNESKPNTLRPRWSKVLSDLWDDKTRTSLVIISIAVGVFAIGMIISAYVILKEDINRSYAAVNPPNIEVWTDPFYEDFVRIIEKVPGVKDAEGRRLVDVRVRTGNENWQNLKLVGVSDFPGKINHLEPIEGTAIPGNSELIVSQNLMHKTGFHTGDIIEIELPDATKHKLTLVGLVTDQTTSRPDPNATNNGYINMQTMRALGLGESFNQFMITVDGDGGDHAYIDSVSASVQDKIERSQREVYRTKEKLSTEHPMTETILAVIGVLGALGGLITILSSSLIINTLNALLTQQLRQIGIMKLVGGRSFQILGMYLILIIAYSLVALVLAVPLGAVAGYALALFITNMMGAVVQGFRIIPTAVITQIVIAILIPLGAGFFPVRSGAKTNVRRAISNYRPTNQSEKDSLFSRNSHWFRWISRPVLLSFRNTFRKRGRLLLTIFTLTVAGAVFIAVFNVRDSMSNLMDQLMQHFLGDVTVDLSQPYPVSQVERSLLAIPGIEFVEGWSGVGGEIWDASDNLVTNITIIAPPQDTKLLTPELVAGRWLIPGEEKAIVVSDTIYESYPDLQPGDRLIIKIPGHLEEGWTVAGIFRFVNMLGDPLAYANFDFITSQLNMANQASSFRIITSSHDAASQRALTGQIDRHLTDRGYAVQGVQSGYLLRENATQAVNILVIFLLIMAILTAFVGSIGLTGTMSINVLERTREIGVMRTIGAVDTVIMQSVIIEAMVIGVITWILAIGISFPISFLLLTIIGKAMMGSALVLNYTPLGILLWLGVVIILSIFASIMPARNAARLTINEVLAYE